MISLYPLLHPRSPMRTWMSQSRAAHPLRSLRSTGSRAAHSLPWSPWSTRSRVAHSPPRSPRSTGSRAAHSPPWSTRSTASRAAHSPPRSPRSTASMAAHSRSSPVPHEGCLLYSLCCALWKQLTPQVVVTRPMSDLCWMSAKQHADHACTQPPCGGEVRGEYNSFILFYIRK